MKACISAGGRVDEALADARGEARQRGAGLGDPIQLGARGGAVGGRRRSAAARDRPAPRARRSGGCCRCPTPTSTRPELARVQALRPGERQPGQRRAAHVVGDVAHRAFEGGRDPRRARAPPAGRARAPPPRAAPRCAGRAPRPAGGCPPRPRRAARRCRPPPPRAPTRPRRAASPRRSAARRARPPPAPPARRRIASARTRLRAIVDGAAHDLQPEPLARARRAHRLEAHALVAVARRLPQQAPQARLRRGRDDQLALGGVALHERRLPARARRRRSAFRPACRRPSRTRARRSSAPADRCRAISLSSVGRRQRGRLRADRAPAPRRRPRARRAGGDSASSAAMRDAPLGSPAATSARQAAAAVRTSS